jgi:hypothetical protein
VIDGARGVEISVGLLRRRDLRDEPIQVRVQPGVRGNAERVGRTLDDPVDIGVVEGVPRRLLILERLAAQRLCRAVKGTGFTG